MNWWSKNILLTTFCCLIGSIFAGRNGKIHHRDPNDTEDINLVETTTIDIVEQIENSYELSSEELNGNDNWEDDKWNNAPNLICSNEGCCKCTEILGNPRTINCKNATLKNYRPLDTAFLSLKKDQSFSAQIADLSYNEIQILRKNHILPNEVNYLVVLDVSNNWLTDIQPYALEPFTKLAKLKLSHNRLTELEISDDWLTPKLGKSLHQLYLDYNYIKELDDGIFDNLVNLTKLILDGNYGLKLTRYTFGKALTRLRTISLDNCGVKSLEEDIFKNLPSLEQLSLAGNPITQIVPAFRQMPKLSVLSLSGTLLTTIPKLAFKWNPELRRIYMTGMKNLKRVESCAFCRLEELQAIDFTNSTQLSEIDENAFGGTSDKEILPIGITDFIVTSCNFTTFGYKLLNWNTLRRLEASDNPWECNCNLYWLLGNRKLQKFTKPDPSCATPKELKNTAFRDASVRMNCVGPFEAPKKADVLPTPAANGSFMSSTALCMLFVGVLVSVLTAGVIFVRRKGGAQAAWAHMRQCDQSRRDAPLGYANLDRSSEMDGTAVVGANIDDYGDAAETRLEDDFNRPEFV